MALKAPPELHKGILGDCRLDSGNVEFRASLDRGTTWGSWYPVAAEAETVGPDWDYLSDGRPLVSWTRSTGNVEYVCNAADGSGTWSAA